MGPSKKSKALNREVDRAKDIQRIDEFIFLIKRGTRRERDEALVSLLEYFTPYIEKYVSLFVGRYVSTSNYDTRIFLGFFLTGRPKTTSNLLKQQQYIAGVMGWYPEEDIRAELTAIFLKVIDKHQIFEGVNALNPLTKIFRYRAKGWFNKAAKRALNKTSMDVDDLPISVDPCEVPLASLDLRWVLAPTEVGLTRSERYLLHLIHYQELPIYKVAVKLDRDKDAIRRQYASLREKLKALISEQLAEDLPLSV